MTRWALDSSVLTDRERETFADKRLYVEVGLVPVACNACGAEVGVKKNSRRHTSIQWSAAAVAACPEFATGAGEKCGGLPLGCSKLKATIDAGVEDGTIVVADD